MATTVLLDRGQAWPSPAAAPESHALPQADHGGDLEAVVHDVGNALTAALGQAQRLQQLCPARAGSSRAAALQTIEANLLFATNLLRQQSRRAARAPCDLAALVRAAVAHLPPARVTDTTVHPLEPRPPAVPCDPLAVTRILANLLDNAAKYSPPGSPIVVAVALANGGVEVVVRDRGIGVPEAQLAAIFAGHRTAAARRMAPGKGVGLRSSRWLAEDMGGRLWAARRARGGTELHFWLPQEASPDAPAKGTRMTGQDDTRAPVLAGLNEDLAGEYQAIISYITYAALVSGPYRPQLVAFFQAEVADEFRHAQFLADKIAALGGEPAVTPKPVVVTRDAREMLEQIRQAETATIAKYRQRITQAEAAGDVGLQVRLEEILADETNHKEEVEKILSTWR